jgi:hypothetical protein
MKRRQLTLILVIIFVFCFKAYSQNSKNHCVISFYNLENLFDTINSPDTKDEEFTPEGSKEWDSKRYFQKLENMSQAISDIGKAEGMKGGPSILGVSEVENISVLKDLIHTKNLEKSGYKIVHYDSPDKRGIDVALLYRDKDFKLTSSKAQPVYIFNPVNGKRIYTRDQLLVSGELKGKSVHLIVNHWPSRWGGELQSQPLRIGAAKVCRHIVDSISKTDSIANIIIMGDFNDDPDNLSVESYLYAGSDKNSLKKKQLYNTTYPIFNSGTGTLKYRGKWNLFDQIIVSQPVIASTNGIKLIKTEIFNAEYLIQQDGKYKGSLLRTFGGKTYLNGYSDHFPSYIVVEAK